MEPKTASVTMSVYTTHKHSNRFNADEGQKNPILDSVYLKKPFAEGAQEIRVTVEVLR